MNKDQPGAVNLLRDVFGMLPKTERMTADYYFRVIDSDNDKALDKLLRTKVNPINDIKKYYLVERSVTGMHTKVLKLLIEKYGAVTTTYDFLNVLLRNQNTDLDEKYRNRFREILSLIKEGGADINGIVRTDIEVKNLHGREFPRHLLTNGYNGQDLYKFKGTPMEYLLFTRKYNAVEILNELTTANIESRHITPPNSDLNENAIVNEISYDPIQQDDVLVNFIYSPANGTNPARYAYNLGKYYKKNSIDQYHAAQGSDRHPVLQGRSIGPMKYYKANLSVAPVNGVMPAPKTRRRGRWCPGGKCPLFGKATVNEGNNIEGGYKRKHRSTRRKSRRSRKNLK